MNAEEIDALRTGAGVRPRPELLTIRLTGPDRVRYLNGMVTSDVARLAPGQAQRAVKTTNKGRVEGVLRVRATEDAFLLDVLDVVANPVAAALMKLLIMDDATLGDASGDREVVALYGPKATEVLRGAGYAGAADLADLCHAEDGAVTVVRDDWLGVPGFELHVAPGEAAAAQAKLEAAGARSVSAEAVDVVRVEAGVPLDGRDIDEDTIPLEARLDAALSFEKGCYVGQEVIARAHNLGGVKHLLVGFEVDGEEIPPAEAEVWVPDADKPTGEVTSAVRSPTLGRIIALGYVRRAHEAPGTAVQIVWGERRIPAKVTRLPFVTA